MFKLIIQSFFKAQDILDTRWPTKAVSLISPTEQRCVPRGDHHFISRFDDALIDCVDADGVSWVAPTRQDVEDILKFTATFAEDDRVIIHCTAGKSRSTAIAIGALVQHGMTPEEAFAHVCDLRPIVIPNHTIIAFIDDILSLEGELIAVNEKHWEKFPIVGNVPVALLRHKIED